MKSECTLNVIIVIPCYNEANNLIQTCRSLGFDIENQQHVADHLLVIVDNNSTDNSLTLAKSFRKKFPQNVFIGKEVEQGYIPPRHKGVIMAREIAHRRRWKENEVLILQADADTHYSANYTNAMKLCSAFFGENVMIEAYTRYPDDFESANEAYISLCNKIDNELSMFFERSRTRDIIIDDKACAYRLSDYFKWGMHQREFLQSGDEIFAETTRLYIKARASRAKKVLLKSACAIHSVRRLIESPLLDFVTAGFPRENSWKTYTTNSINIPHKLPDFNTQDLSKAIPLRKLHLIALFSILPTYIERTLRVNSKTNQHHFKEFIDTLPVKSIQTLIAQPSEFLTEIFLLINQCPDLILNRLTEIE